MLFPLHASLRSRRLPVFTMGLIGANFLVGYHMVTMRDWELVPFFLEYGLVPSRFLTFQPEGLLGALTCMFLHGDLGHIVGNMWFLGVYGDDLEGKLGRFRFLAIYLLSGLGASLAFVATRPDSDLPCVGASGAISGVMGAYLFHFPGANVRCLFLFFPMVRLIDVPAIFILLLYFLLDVAWSILAPWARVAFTAHIGGFLTGLLLAILASAYDRYGRTA